MATQDIRCFCSLNNLIQILTHSTKKSGTLFTQVFQVWSRFGQNTSLEKKFCWQETLSFALIYQHVTKVQIYHVLNMGFIEIIQQFKKLSFYLCVYLCVSIQSRRKMFRAKLISWFLPPSKNFRSTSLSHFLWNVFSVIRLYSQS